MNEGVRLQQNAVTPAPRFGLTRPRPSWTLPDARTEPEPADVGSKAEPAQQGHSLAQVPITADAAELAPDVPAARRFLPLLPGRSQPREPRPLSPFVLPQATRTAAPAPRLDATPQVIQRQVDLDEFNSRLGEDEQLSNETLGRLKEIQALLKDPKAVHQALGSLEESAERYSSHWAFGNASPTQALDAALQDTESQWMNPGRVKVTSDEIVRQEPKQLGQKKSEESYPIAQGGGTMPPETFVDKALSPMAPLKDVGAGPHHGEYAHRLQWQIIHHHLNDKFNRERSEGPKSGSELQHLYTLMSNPKRVIDHPLGLQEKGGDPVRISLWDAVLDARGEWTAGKHDGKPNQDVGQMYGDVGFAAPGLLTGALTDRSRSPVLKNYDTYLKGQLNPDHPEHAGSWAQDFPTISDAVTSRKLKRMQKK